MTSIFKELAGERTCSPITLITTYNTCPSPYVCLCRYVVANRRSMGKEERVARKCQRIRATCDSGKQHVWSRSTRVPTSVCKQRMLLQYWRPLTALQKNLDWLYGGQWIKHRRLTSISSNWHREHDSCIQNSNDDNVQIASYKPRCLEGKVSSKYTYRMRSHGNNWASVLRCFLQHCTVRSL